LDLVTILKSGIVILFKICTAIRKPISSRNVGNSPAASDYATFQAIGDEFVVIDIAAGP
jgi:hypothetical protein